MVLNNLYDSGESQPLGDCFLCFWTPCGQWLWPAPRGSRERVFESLRHTLDSHCPPPREAGLAHFLHWWPPQWDGPHLALWGAMPGCSPGTHGPCLLCKWPLGPVTTLVPCRSAGSLGTCSGAISCFPTYRFLLLLHVITWLLLRDLHSSPTCTGKGPLAQTLTVVFILFWMLRELPECQIVRGEGGGGKNGGSREKPWCMTHLFLSTPISCSRRF